MINLHGSRWAPASSRTQSNLNPLTSTLVTPTATSSALTPAQKQYQARLQDFHRFGKLFRRLKWKSSALMGCFDRTLALTQGQVRDSDHALGDFELRTEPAEAEMMFKIDFYEWYMLLERVLVHLLGVWGLVISAAAGAGTSDVVGTPASSKGNDYIIGDSRAFHGYSHRFHANVLQALDLPTNPLHEILGVGDVRSYLGLAKEFRNKWKDAEDRPSDAADDDLPALKMKRYEKILRDLRLEQMLGSVLRALERAAFEGENEIQRCQTEIRASATEHGASLLNGLENDAMELEMEDTPWEAMPDAMEWD